MLALVRTLIDAVVTASPKGLVAEESYVDVNASSIEMLVDPPLHSYLCTYTRLDHRHEYEKYPWTHNRNRAVL